MCIYQLERNVTGRKIPIPRLNPNSKDQINAAEYTIRGYFRKFIKILKYLIKILNYFF